MLQLIQHHLPTSLYTHEHVEAFLAVAGMSGQRTRPHPHAVCLPNRCDGRALSPLHSTICLVAVCVGEDEDSGPDGLQSTCTCCSACLHFNVFCHWLCTMQEC